MRDLVIERDIEVAMHGHHPELLAQLRCAICHCVNNLLSWSIAGRNGLLITCSSHYCRAKAQQQLDSRST